MHEDDGWPSMCLTCWSQCDKHTEKAQSPYFQQCFKKLYFSWRQQLWAQWSKLLKGRLSPSVRGTRKCGLINVDTRPLTRTCKEVKSPFRNINIKLPYKKPTEVLWFKTELTRTGNFVLKIFSRLILRKHIAVIALKAFLVQFLQPLGRQDW